MKAAALQQIKLSSIQLIILIFTIVYGMNVLASEVKHTSKPLAPSIKSMSIKPIILAKGQAYVPPLKDGTC